MDTFEKICSVIAQVRDIDSASLSRDDLLTEIYFDSIDAVEVLMALEDEFDVEITEQEANSFRTLGDIEDCIDRKGLEA